jgi:hypothetical protein
MQKKTKKQEQYLEEVIRLHYEKGYGEDRISRILPIGHSTVSRWIGIFASENDAKSNQMSKPQLKSAPQPSVPAPAETDVSALRSEIVRLQSQLKHERLRAEAYDEMIRVAETRFNISIRKKAGAKR